MCTARSVSIRYYSPLADDIFRVFFRLGDRAHKSRGRRVRDAAVSYNTLIQLMVLMGSLVSSYSSMHGREEDDINQNHVINCDLKNTDFCTLP